jgi:hypothetical protein
MGSLYNTIYSKAKMVFILNYKLFSEVILESLEKWVENNLWTCHKLFL